MRIKGHTTDYNQSAHCHGNKIGLNYALLVDVTAHRHHRITKHWYTAAFPAVAT
jgi:hypothetical protein